MYDVRIADFVTQVGIYIFFSYERIKRPKWMSPSLTQHPIIKKKVPKLHKRLEYVNEEFISYLLYLNILVMIVGTFYVINRVIYCFLAFFPWGEYKQINKPTENKIGMTELGESLQLPCLHNIINIHSIQVSRCNDLPIKY